MRSMSPCLVIACAIVLTTAGVTSAVTMDWVTVGNPGNAPDPADGDQWNPGTQSFGAVSYSYSIGKYEVTYSQYAEFLNTVDPTGANLLGLYNNNMNSTLYGGVTYNSGAANGDKYALIAGNEQHPVNYVSIFDAMRFANWLNNGGLATSDTESGSYTFLHEGSPGPTPFPSNQLSLTRNAGATIYIPDEDEWYKAAFFDPNSATDSYFLYPTSSDSDPIASAPTALPNHVNYDGAASFTDVGVYSGTTSPIGAYDMAGNAVEWTDTYFGTQRVVRGGWILSNLPSDLSSSGRDFLDQVGNYASGFRLVMVPEPGAALLAALGLLGLVVFGWRRTRRACGRRFVT